MLRVSALLLLIYAIWPPSATRAQDPRLATRLDSVTRIRVEAVLGSARAEGLPTEPLVQKALEGSSKGAAGPRIVVAVGTMLADLRHARQALGDAAGSDELLAAVAALRAGATPVMVGEIRRVGPLGGVAVPLAVFADLVSYGMTTDAAWRSVSELAEKGGDEEEFLDLRDRLRPVLESP
jgi:hypothetical protein